VGAATEPRHSDERILSVNDVQNAILLADAWNAIRENVGPLMEAHEWSVRDLSGGFIRLRARSGLDVIVTCSIKGDKKRWLHVSLAHRDRLTSWDEIVDAKRALLGAEAEAYQVIPKESRYVNIHPYTHHFFHCLDGDVLPDFSGLGDAR